MKAAVLWRLPASLRKHVNVINPLASTSTMEAAARSSETLEYKQKATEYNPEEIHVKIGNIFHRYKP